MISSAEEGRDWESVRDLYHPRATLVRTGIDESRAPFVTVLSFDEYVDNATELLRNMRFSEVELQLDVTAFGNVARAASIYEYKRVSNGETSTGRGVNFFNFVNEGSGWKIMNIVWDNERDDISLRDAGLYK